MPISLVRSDGVIFPYEQENFTYCPEPEESTAMPVSCSPSVKRQRLDQEIHGMSEMGNGAAVSVNSSSDYSFNLCLENEQLVVNLNLAKNR